MVEHIARETVIELFNKWADGYSYIEVPTKDAIACVRAIPAADVRPVVRGTWVGIDDFPHDDWECDHCGGVVENTNDPWNYYHFCPNCGADMRGENK